MRIKRFFWIAACLPVFFLASAGSAEEKEEDRLYSFGLSLGYLQVADELLPTPFLHSGVIYGAAVGYEKTSGPNRHLIDLGFRYADVTNRFSLPALGVEYALGYRWLRRHDTLFDRAPGKIMIGGMVRHGNLLTYHPYIDEAHLFWRVATDIGVAASFEMGTPNGAWRIDAALPLVALISRPEYERRYNTDQLTGGYLIETMHASPAFGFIGSFVDAEITASYRFQTTGEWIPSVGYRLRFLYDAEPRTLTTMTHLLTFTLQRGCGKHEK